MKTAYHGNYLYVFYFETENKRDSILKTTLLPGITVYVSRHEHHIQLLENDVNE